MIKFIHILCTSLVKLLSDDQDMSRFSNVVPNDNKKVRKIY